MSKFDLQFKSFGDSAILIEWPSKISEIILEDIRNFYQKINHSNVKGIIDVNFVYHSMLVVYDNNIIPKKELTPILRKIYSKENTEHLEVHKIWNIPVCYDFGLDLDTILNDKELSKEDFIALHSFPEYTVYGIGFLPGFLYLGGLNDKLVIPRKEVPRLNVFKGAVAIGGNQTGVYPQDSPGGWHIIGKTPISFFDSSQENPTFINPGDKIKFFSVSKSRFKLLEIEIASEIYNYNR